MILLTVFLARIGARMATSDERLGQAMVNTLRETGYDEVWPELFYLTDERRAWPTLFDRFSITGDPDGRAELSLRS